MTTYEATFQHCELIRRKINDLSVRLVEAQAQLYTAINREYRDGRLDMDDLALIYERARGLGPGFTTRWDEHMSVPAGTVQYHWRNRVKTRPNAPGGTHWQGCYPYEPDTITPPRGQAVVYVLYDVDARPIYVGSTKVFRDRMRSHRRDGKPMTSWLAYPCDSREAAYLLESKLLDECRPSMNRTGRGAAA
ncbi:hypothetical protein [Micromonospora sp. MA102]|uniref:hypothetical protein n=1 Tax=Micromonospora sp. MA102 TaxID=2952755 RepID=UPI0021C75128|nr:hypothetical protein [Micromonospora sp. MA102]